MSEEIFKRIFQTRYKFLEIGTNFGPGPAYPQLSFTSLMYCPIPFAISFVTVSTIPSILVGDIYHQLKLVAEVSWMLKAAIFPVISIGLVIAVARIRMS